MTRFADRLGKIAPFRVMQLLERAMELEEEGKSVIHLEVGEPDFATAAPIAAAGRAALSEGRTRYTQALGIPELKERIAGHYALMGITVDPACVCVTAGASGGLTLLAALLLNPGDELLITDPGYPCNEVFAHLVNAVPKAITLSAAGGFQPTWPLVNEHWGKATRGALLASPANPTGVMIRRSVLRDLITGIRKRHGFLIMDEIYQGLVHNPSEQYPSVLSVVAEMPDEPCDLYVLNSFSKYFGMTGWRLGWLVVPPDAVDGLARLAQNLTISPSAPAQHAALAAFSEPVQAIHEERRQRLTQRKDVLLKGLLALGFTVPVPPDGAFYLYVDVSHTNMTAHNFCWRFLNEYFVATTPGEDFATFEHERYVRFACTADVDTLDVALSRLAQALEQWRDSSEADVARVVQD